MGIVVGSIKDEEFFPRTFGAELSDDYKYDPEKIFQYYAENFELLYRQFSNSQGGCRDGQEKSETAEIALKRYNDLSFETQSNGGNG